MGHIISTPKVSKMAEYKQGIIHRPCPPLPASLAPTHYIIIIYETIARYSKVYRVVVTSYITDI